MLRMSEKGDNSICTNLTSNEIFSLAIYSRHFNSRCEYGKSVVGWENLVKAVVMNEVIHSYTKNQ